MIKLDIDIHEDAVSIIDKIKDLNETGVELVLPIGSVIFDNFLNLKLIEKQAERIGKTVQFMTDDMFGKNLISMLNEEENNEFNSHQTFNSIQPIHTDTPVTRKRLKLPSFIKVKSPLKGRKAKVGKLVAVGVVACALLGFVLYRAIWAVPKAHVKVVVNAQPLIKSIQVKTIKDGTSNADSKTLRGYEVQTVITKEGMLETTGEKIIGEKAKGTIKIFNKTTTQEEFEKGQVVRFDDDTDLDYELLDDVTVPARSEDPVTLVITPGEATVKVQAVQIGSAYNIDKDEDLDIDDYDNDDFSAKTTEDFSGGKSETKKVVTEADKTALSQSVLTKNKDSIESELSSRAGIGKKYVHGSLTSTVTKETFEPAVGEEANEVKLSQEVTAVGLAYSDRELKELLEQMLDEFVPEGYELSEQDTEINAEVLGNSETTKVSSTEADLQVTIKAFVIVEVNEDEMKAKLANLGIEDAQKYLGGIRNIETYELNVSPNIPFLKKMPKNPNNITVDIVKK